jgi:ABC-type sugar transport system permease subunit
MSSLSFRGLMFRLVALIVIDAFAINLIYGVATRFSVPLAIGIFVGTVLINFVYLFDRFGVWRWTAPGLALMALLVFYPLVNTVVVAFTNYSDGHLSTQAEVEAALAKEFYKPPNAISYKPTVYLSNTPSSPVRGEDFILGLTDPDGKQFLATPKAGIIPLADAEKTFGAFGEKNAEGFPATVGNFKLVPRLSSLQYLQVLKDQLSIQTPDALVRVESLDAAPQLVKRFDYNRDKGTLLDRESNRTYVLERGAFVYTKENGEKETLLGVGGWPVFIGTENFTKAILSDNVRGPFLGVFLWTVAFAIGSVFTTFALGLGFALVLNGNNVPLRGVFRSILILPYALPAFISILVWKGLLQPSGFVTEQFRAFTGVAPQWFDDPVLAKIAILLVNLWLGYPYMMLIASGALQSIPGDLYEAAVIDGANALQQFRKITVPLLLVAVGPLLIGSFAYNFNNFAIIQLLTAGGPRNDVGTAAGQTDIMISYTYRLAFGGTKGIDYGFASAITIFIFVIVAGVTIYNFRLSRNLEQVYTNN